LPNPCHNNLSHYFWFGAFYPIRILGSGWLVNIKKEKCKQVKANTISRQLIDLAERSGIRKKEGEVLKENKKRAEIRKDVPIAHGFRKFFSSKLVEADLRIELRWLLEGRRT
jgi:hypothetical protein